MFKPNRSTVSRWLLSSVFSSLLFGVSSIIHAQCGPAAYPPAGDDPNTYNSAYSTMCNWNDPNRGQDITITNGAAGWTGVTATQSVALAGAIVSLKMGGEEVIQSGGHGAALNWSFYPQSYDTASSGECYNPTLSGSYADDSQAGWNYAPWHGPSTSSIDLALGSKPGELYSVSRMAFFVPNNQAGFGNCTASYPSRYTAYTWSSGGVLSPFRLTQEATWYAYNVNNALGVGGTITVDDVHKPNYKLNGIAYLQPDFNTYYTFDPAQFQSGTNNGLTYIPLSSFTGTYPSPAGASTVPIIAATSDGAYAVGIINDNLYAPTQQRSQESHYYYLGYSDGTQYNRLNTVEVTYTGNHGTDLTVGTQLSYRVFYVFGNLDWVKWGINQIYLNQGSTY